MNWSKANRILEAIEEGLEHKALSTPLKGPDLNLVVGSTDTRDRHGSGERALCVPQAQRGRPLLLGHPANVSPAVRAGQRQRPLPTDLSFDSPRACAVGRYLVEP